MGGGGNILDYDLGGSGGMPPQKFFECFCALRQLLVQSEAKILIELLININFVADILNEETGFSFI